MNKILAGFTFLSVLVILLGINRGFDISDEGLYMLLADPEQQNIGGIFNYDLFFKFFYKITGLQFGIVGLRIIRLLSYFLGAFSLTHFWKNVQHQKALSFSIFLFALSGLLAGYGFLPPSLSYNSVSVVAVCFWLAIVSRNELRLLQWFLLGFVFLLLFYAKITVFLSLGLLTILFFLLKKSISILKLGMLLLPLLFFEAIFYILFQENALTRLTAELGFLHQREDYNAISMINYTSVGGFWIFLSGALFFVAAKLKKLGFKYHVVVLGLALLALASVFYLTFITSEWSHIVMLATFAGISWQLGSLDARDFLRRELLVVLILFLLPFILHFGSNVYWMRLGIHYWVFWLVAFAILIEKKRSKSHDQFYSIVSIISLVVVIFGIWLTPFEGVYLWDSTEKWEYQPEKEILLSTEYIKFLKNVNHEIVTSKSKNVVALYGNPGILYLLGKTSPYYPGYWKSSQAELFLNDGNELDLILFNELYEFPFNRNEWSIRKELVQPNGEKLQVLWRK